MPASQNPAVAADRTSQPGALSGLRVVELADEQAEYCGLTLAGLGADVVKVEPPGGSPTRRIGPFYQDKADTEGSLFFWQYNRGKRSIELDLKREQDRQHFAALLASADILLESTPKGELAALGLGPDVLSAKFPTLIHARVTPFGDDGPWSDFKACDLVHLALGGVMMNCGYDPAPDGKYDLPPIAPQMWHAYHVAGEQMSMAILAALMFRFRTGKGQQVSCAIHEAVAKCTEVDLMTWVMRRSPVLRQTCRHAREAISPHPTIAHTKDGRWVMANLGNRPDDGERLVELLERYGIEPGIDPKTATAPRVGRFVPGTAPDTSKRDPAMEAVQRFVRSFTYENMPWREAQQAGMLWAPLEEAARECHGPALARARQLHRCRASRARPVHSAMPRASGSARRRVGRRDGGRPGSMRMRPPSTLCRCARRRPSIRSPSRRAPASPPVAASRSRSTAFASSISPGSWRPPAARGS